MPDHLNITTLEDLAKEYNIPSSDVYYGYKIIMKEYFKNEKHTDKDIGIVRDELLDATRAYCLDIKLMYERLGGD